MIRINKNYIDKFYKNRLEYLYPLSKGLYLAFDSETLEYIGIEEFYLADPKKVNKMESDLLELLVSRDILEVI